jgi:hypothetical protein
VIRLLRRNECTGSHCAKSPPGCCCANFFAAENTALANTSQRAYSAGISSIRFSFCGITCTGRRLAKISLSATCFAARSSAASNAWAETLRMVFSASCFNLYRSGGINGCTGRDSSMSSPDCLPSVFEPYWICLHRQGFGEPRSEQWYLRPYFRKTDCTGCPCKMDSPGYSVSRLPCPQHRTATTNKLYRALPQNQIVNSAIFVHPGRKSAKKNPDSLRLCPLSNRR